MREQIKSLEHILASGTAAQHATFALLCAERMEACWWCFESIEREERPVARQVIEAMFVDMQPEASTLHHLVELLNAEIPSSEDYGDALASQAQAYGICALVALKCALGEPSLPLALEAAQAVMDSIELYLFCVEQEFGASPQEIDCDAFYAEDLMVRELRRQVADAAYVVGIESSSAISVRRWRRLNRNFVVPPARPKKWEAGEPGTRERRPERG